MSTVKGTCSLGKSGEAFGCVSSIHAKIQGLVVVWEGCSWLHNPKNGSKFMAGSMHAKSSRQSEVKDGGTGKPKE